MWKEEFVPGNLSANKQTISAVFEIKWTREIIVKMHV